MPVQCVDCAVTFPLLEESSEKCWKCLEIGKLKSDPERNAIKALHQCSGCGMVTQKNKGALCSECIGNIASMDSIPASLLMANGVIEQLQRHRNLLGNRRSDATSMPPPSLPIRRTASQILVPSPFTSDEGNPQLHSSTQAANVLVSSHAWQSKASDVRLIGSKRATASSKPTNLSTSAGITKARKDARQAYELRTAGERVKFTATIWETRRDEKGNIGKMQEIKNISITQTFSPDDATQNVFDDMFIKVKEKNHQRFPDRKDLMWSNVQLAAQSTQHKFTSFHLQNDVVNEARCNTIGQVLEHFRKQQWGGVAALAQGEMEIRFVYQVEDVTPECEPEEDLESHSSVPASSKKRRASPLFLTSAMRSAKQPRLILRSAFRPPTAKLETTQYTRRPPMVKAAFWPYQVSFNNEGQYTFEDPDMSISPTEIWISTDWQVGQQLAKNEQKFDTTGFLGTGFTKRAIYCRINNREYALVQHKLPDGDERALLNDLAAEHELLALGNHFQREFSDWAKQRDYPVPEFRFMFKDSFLGVLTHMSDGDEPAAKPAGLLYFHFLATPLLPCRSFDGQMIKVSGNEKLGVPRDRFALALHAFTHFVWIASRRYLLFCDLQGLTDTSNVMCLIDPQAHTSENDPNNRHYWDLGPDRIAIMLQEHEEVCAENRFCVGLGLKELQLQDNDDETKMAGESGENMSGYIGSDDNDDNDDENDQLDSK